MINKCGKRAPGECACIVEETDWVANVYFLEGTPYTESLGALLTGRLRKKYPGISIKIARTPLTAEEYASITESSRATHH